MENNNKQEIASQIKNAFDFIQKLFNESSYLIKEIEGQLAESVPKFSILKTSGYAISSRSSNGLEPTYVNFWLLRKFGVAFVEETSTELKKGQNSTEINDSLKVLYFRIILDDKEHSEPQLLFGVLYNIKKKKEHIKKFESLMTQIEYADDKFFAKFPNIDYDDSAFRMKGKFKKVNLLDINSSNELVENVIKPTLKLYGSIK